MRVTHDSGRSGALQEVGDFSLPGARSDADGHQTGPLATDVRRVDGGAVGKLDREPVATRVTRGDETGGDRVGPSVVVAPRRGLARGRLDERDRVGTLSRVLGDESADRRRLGGRSRHGNGFGGVGSRNSSVAFCQHIRRTSAAGTPAKWRRNSGWVSGQVESACG